MSGAGYPRGDVGGADMAGRLERRYLRLLAWYPRDHRREHAEEMLGVLMAASGPGQTRPGGGESVNLMAGAMRIRLRQAARSFAEPAWRDALAVLSVLAPALALTVAIGAARPGVEVLTFARPLGGMTGWWVAAGLAPVALLAGWAIATGAALLRKRRAATVAVAIVLPLQTLTGIVSLVYGEPPPPAVLAPAVLCLGVLAMVGLLGSEGPERGLRLMGRWRSWLLAAGLPVWVAAADSATSFRPRPLGAWPYRVLAGQLAGSVAIAVKIALVVTITLAVRSPVGRRVLAVALPAAVPSVLLYAAALVTGEQPLGARSAVVLVWAAYLALALVVAVLAVTARRAPGIRPGAAIPGA